MYFVRTLEKINRVITAPHCNRIFAQITTIPMRCSVQNITTIEQFLDKLYANQMMRHWIEFKMTFGRIFYIATALVHVVPPTDMALIMDRHCQIRETWRKVWPTCVPTGKKLSRKIWRKWRHGLRSLNTRSAMGYHEISSAILWGCLTTTSHSKSLIAENILKSMCNFASALYQNGDKWIQRCSKDVTQKVSNHRVIMYDVKLLILA